MYIWTQILVYESVLSYCVGIVADSIVKIFIIFSLVLFILLNSVEY